MSFYLGLDAGGTSTQCALADESGIAGRVEGASIKPTRASSAEAEAALRKLLDDVSAAAGVALNQVASTCIGIAGLRLPDTRRWITALLTTLVGGVVAVCGDEEIALDAAFPGGSGVLVVSGTGSNIVGRTRDGRMFNVGGWGPGIGDEGSGYWIGHRALNAACRAYDRGEPTQLLDRIAEHWSAAEGLEAVVALANQKPAPDFSRLARLTAEAAAQGDTVALRTLREAGELLAADALLAYRKVQAAEEDAEVLDMLLDVPRPCIAYTGGILRHVAPVRERMIEFLRESLPTVTILDGAVDPVQGALWRARRALEIASANSPATD